MGAEPHRHLRRRAPTARCGTSGGRWCRPSGCTPRCSPRRPSRSRRWCSGCARSTRRCGIAVQHASTENLNLPTLNDVDVGECMLGQTTAEQNQLFANRNNAGAQRVVVYFVRSTVPPFNGCAAHPAGRPGAVVAQGATQWTLGHEVGHVLGLAPRQRQQPLMTGNGRATSPTRHPTWSRRGHHDARQPVHDRSLGVRHGNVMRKSPGRTRPGGAEL